MNPPGGWSSSTDEAVVAEPPSTSTQSATGVDEASWSTIRPRPVAGAWIASQVRSQSVMAPELAVGSGELGHERRAGRVGMDDLGEFVPRIEARDVRTEVVHERRRPERELPADLHSSDPPACGKNR